MITCLMDIRRCFFFLSKLGILRSFSIVCINCLYLFGGLYFVRKIFRYIRSPYFLFFLVLLNWTVIKFVTHPLSEMQYLFFSLASLYAFYLFVEQKKITHLFLAFLLAGFAFLTRTVGISLVAALLVSLIWEYRKELIGLIKKNKIAVIVARGLYCIVLIFSRQLGLNHYTGVMSKQFNEGLRFRDVILWHFSEWGELFLNTSKFKVISYLPGRLGGTVIPDCRNSGDWWIYLYLFHKKKPDSFYRKILSFFLYAAFI